MAKAQHCELLRKDVAAWNAQRLDQGSPVSRATGQVDLSYADLSNIDLADADLSLAILSGANLSGTRLARSNLIGADLDGADLSEAQLMSANLSTADLSNANLFRASMDNANLSDVLLHRTDLRFARLFGVALRGSKLKNTDLTGAFLGNTVFSDVDLSGAIGLDTCHHYGASSIDHRSLVQSNMLPLYFLRGIGLPDSFIEYTPSLLNRAVQYYSCFISYSTKDQEFAERLHADLQNNGVRCWFAPHDLRTGDKILDEIDAAIRLRDKVLLILSEHSIRSDWVEDEVTAAFEEERKRGRTMLFPIRLDEAVMNTSEAWAGRLRSRLIADFQHWKDHDSYKRSFERVLRDLATNAE